MPVMLKRRDFLQQTACTAASTLFVFSCTSPSPEVSLLSVGPLSNFPVGVTALELYRVLILRAEHNGVNEYRAVSLVCTHMTCLLNPVVHGSQLNSFTCPCHGSSFSATGAVVSGPAPRALDWYQLQVSETRELLIDKTVAVPASWSLSIKSTL